MTSDPRASRQSFLGRDAQSSLAAAQVALLGLGGGGSHVVQQLAHLGFKSFVLLDPDRVEDTNLNRLIGATEQDALHRTYKVDIASRLIRGLASDAVIESAASRWQDDASRVRGVDIVFGCLDGFLARRELEEFTRRYMIPLIDIGLGVQQAEGWPPQMAGQVIASIPGGPCMWCLGFLNEHNLSQEATAYGDAGVRPQVVWANGVLASTAVGIAVQILTGWTKHAVPPYLEYDANLHTVKPPARLKHLQLDHGCRHYPTALIGAHGDPVLTAR